MLQSREGPVVKIRAHLSLERWPKISLDEGLGWKIRVCIKVEELVVVNFISFQSNFFPKVTVQLA
jgi:hypothetical protein